jgi:hypothetical protein
MRLDLLFHGAEKRSRYGRIALRISVVLLTAVLLVDPGDALLHLKIPVFALVMVLWLLQTPIWEPILRLNVLIAIFVVSVVLPTLWILVSLLTAPSLDLDNLLAYPKAFLFIFLLLVIVNEHIALDLIAVRLSIFIALLTISLVVLSMAFPELFIAVYSFASEKEVAIISEGRDQFGIGVGQFYYKTAPIMLFGLTFFLHRWLFRRSRMWDIPLSLLFLVALLFSGARANVIAAFAAVAVLTIAKVARRFGPIAATVLATVLLVVPVALFSASLLNPSETSNEIKALHSGSYAEHFEDHPSYLLLGQGEGTRFYSRGFQDFTTVTELSYFELVRQFGIPVTVVFVIFLLSPMIVLIRNRPFESDYGYLAVGYGAYLLVSATNPLLISSTGMLVVVMVWARALELQDPAVPARHGAELTSA